MNCESRTRQPESRRICQRVSAFLIAPCLALQAAVAPSAAAQSPPAGVPVVIQSPGRPGFTLLSSDQTGLRFANQLSDSKAAENQIRLNGSGVALGDINGDGRCDIYFCGLEGANALYRNQGAWKFQAVPAAGGAACEGQYSTGAALADVDGDSDLDLLVNGIGVGTRLFLNDGQGNFTESQRSGLHRSLGATSLALADVDGDDDLDLYVANYRTTTIRTTGFAVLNVGGRRMVRPEDRDQLEYTPEGRILEHGEPDSLYLNDGQGRFQAVSWTDGTFLDEEGKPLAKPPFDWGLAAMFRDINQDRAPDLYVCNDFHSTDKIWINDGRGRFRALPRLALRKTSTFSMAVDFGDLNRDGWDDLFVADMLSLNHARRLMQLAATDPYRPEVGIIEDRPQFDRNTLHLNRGDGTYAEIAAYADLAASEWTWSAMLLDVDLDGYEDLLCSTGHMFDTQDLDAEARIQAKGPWPRDQIPLKLLMFPRMQQPKVAFRNRGDLTFERVSQAWGFDQVGVAHGMATGDLDNDGDLDVVVNNLNAPAGIYRNDSPAPRVAVRLRGKPPNTQGIGARIRVAGGPAVQTQEMIAGGRYLSGDDGLRVFAAREATNEVTIEVTWRTGGRTVIDRAPANRIHTIQEIEGQEPNPGPSGESQTSDLKFQISNPRSQASNPTSQISDGGARLPDSSGQVLFEDASHLLNHTHQDEPYDDFARQPLLPRQYSQLGPGLAWFDVNQDGWDDLIVGAGKGGKPACYLNDGQGGFKRSEADLFQHLMTRDQSGVLAWPAASGQVRVLAGSSNYEDGLDAGSIVRQFDLHTGVLLDIMPGHGSSAGPLAMADVDGDGDLDLFVGGRCIPGRWPEAATSLFFKNEHGQLVIDVQRTSQLVRVGLVSGAVWSDLHGDGFPELILACEWGPLRIFNNESGQLQPWDPPLVAMEPSSSGVQRPAPGGLTLGSLTGWWNGVASGDFDNDGRIDLAASNWGLNNSHQSAAAWPSGPFSRTALPHLESGVSLLYHGDFDGNGTRDIFEARWDRELNKIVPIRSLSAIAAGYPLVRARFNSFAAFNESALSDLLGDVLRTNTPLRANWLASTVFLNRGGRFEAVPLPAEAQFAPAFGVVVSDADGDGNEDLLLSQNFFSVQPTSWRLDAGRGLWLRSDGRGGFSSVPGQESGLLIYGEGRGAAVSDFDGDGRPDLAVAQNGAGTKLYRNAGARLGLRVRLDGPPQNPHAAGAALRLIYDSKRGPVREIQAGSGYWSQNSPVALLGVEEKPAKVWVRWPGGKITESPIPPDARFVSISQDGTMRNVNP